MEGLLSPGKRNIFGNLRPHLQLPKYKSKSLEQTRFDLNVMRLLAQKNLPFSFVEDAAWKQFVMYVHPRALTKTALTFSRNKLPILKYNVQLALNKVLEVDLVDCPGVAITTDLWTSQALDPYIGLTLHYLDAEWAIKRFVIACRLAPGKLF